MRKLSAVLFLSLYFFCSGNSSEIYKQIKIYIPDQVTFQKLLQTGIDLEGAEGKIGDWIQIVVNEKELELLKTFGFVYLILIDDYSKFLESRLYKGPYNALGFGYGSMGGYYTYNEVIQQLDSMKLLYPNLITAKQVIGTSIQGRYIFAVKISDNPDLNESNEPSVLYTALTHAREPQGMMTVIYYMWWLLENYNNNPEANYLVNNRQMWFIPVINPDGYVYNQTTNPNGGGMWRKNRRNNGDGSFGVDLNRNFGPYAYWDAPNGGSSTTPSTDTYRGVAPFSEPETYTIQNFLAGKNIRACLNYHTYSNLLIYPYGALVRETPDSLIYREFAKEMTKYNGYVYGTDQQTVGYATRGNSDDYMYDGNIPNNGKIFAMTPEVGSSSDGFWPPTPRILPLALENLYPNKFLSKVVGAYPQVSSFNIQDSSGDNFIERGEKFVLSVVYRNKGLDSAKDLTLHLSSSNNDLIIPTEPVYIDNFSPLSNQIVNFECRVKKRATTGVNAKLFLTATNNSGYISFDTLNIIIGKLNLTFADSANDSTIQNWSTGLSWGITTDAQSPPFSFTDSPIGNYANGTDNSLSLLVSKKLAGSSIIKLFFSAKWKIESKYDFALVEVSSNGGTSWTSVKGKYTKPGSGVGVQTIGTFGYDGIQSNWIDEEMDLSAFASSQFKFRFRLRSDPTINNDGFYVDNIRLLYCKVDSAKYADMVITPQEINFGNVNVYNFKDSTIQIQNLTSSNDSLRCNLQLKYGIDFILNSNSKFSIPIGSEQNISITFAPISIGLIADTLIINHSSDSYENPILIPLYGYSIISNKFYADIVVKNGLNVDTLYFGADEDASDTLDAVFGETELEELPPSGVFDVRWLIDGTNGTKVDIRDTVSDENIRNVYSLRYQLSNFNDTIVFQWNRNKLPSGTLILKDSSTNGAIVSVNMRNNDYIKVLGESASPLLILHEMNPLLVVKVNKGWSLVSVPTLLSYYSKDFVFPGSVSSAYGYDNYLGYLPVDTLSIGRGYWLKFNLTREYLFTTPQVLIDTITLSQGWNLIGAIGRKIKIENIETEPTNIISSPIYGYYGGYISIDTLKPGYGYWVKSTDNGKLILNALNLKNNFSKRNINNELLNSLIVTDNSGNRGILFFTEENIVDKNYYSLPPLPPSEIFDVRFKSQNYIEVLDGVKNKSCEIQVQSKNYPIKVSFENILRKGINWMLRVESSDGKIKEYKLPVSYNVVIDKPDDRIFLRASKIGEAENLIPLEYSLAQNYPNPFNSKTQIKYSIPENTFVSLRLYDVLGREVKILVNKQLPAGYYTYDLDASIFSSSVYFYKLQAGKFVDIKKMMLLK
ncbi:MAG: Fibronectin type III domain protein [Ignavibacteriae bacterium]|nr:MAG: Fibronectin type III domain protein [Ignavibacteriota bacterium]